MVLAGLVGTARMFHEEYVGPLPAVVKGFAPMTIGGDFQGGAPPLSNRPLSSLRPAQTLASPAERGNLLAARATLSAGIQETASPEQDRADETPIPVTAPGESKSEHSAADSGNASPLAMLFLPVVQGDGDQASTLAATDAPAAEAAPVVAGDSALAGAPTGANPGGDADPRPPALPEWIDIPVIDLSAPVTTVQAVPVRVSGQSLQQWSAPDLFAAGWHESSALLGLPGNTVLNGHHNIYGSVFARLRDLQVGDEIYVWGEGRAYFYEVDQVKLLEERFVGLASRTENARWILPSEDERLTLVTCWPPESNTHRLIVVARPVP